MGSGRRRQWVERLKGGGWECVYLPGDVISFSGTHQRINFVFIYLYLFLIGTHTHFKVLNISCMHTQADKQGFIPLLPQG